MKSRDNLLRLKHFQVEEKTRQLAQIDMMINEFEKVTNDLSDQIKFEEEKSGITDTSHFAYPTFAKAARQRMENLEVSIRELQDKRGAAADALQEAEDDLKKAQLKDERDGGGSPVEVEAKPHLDRSAMIG